MNLTADLRVKLDFYERMWGRGVVGTGMVEETPRALR
jgi:hypothetical protein